MSEGEGAGTGVDLRALLPALKTRGPGFQAS